MGSRFFLIPFFPSLSYDSTPLMSLYEAEFFCRLNLSHHDQKAMDCLYTLNDLDNIRSFFAGIPMTATGSIPHEELRERLENDECPLEELEDFFALHTTFEARSTHMHELFRSFCTHLSPDLPRFVHQYFVIVHTSRHLMAYLRATELGQVYALDPEEIGFDIKDTNTWPPIYRPLITIWQSRLHNPADLERAVSQWKFDLIDTLVSESGPFSLDRILAYLLRLRIVEERRELTNPIHMNTLERVVRAIQ
jgi:hypothetical protein